MATAGSLGSFSGRTPHTDISQLRNIFLQLQAYECGGDVQLPLHAVQGSIWRTWRAEHFWAFAQTSGKTFSKWSCTVELLSDGLVGNTGLPKLNCCPLVAMAEGLPNFRFDHMHAWWRKECEYSVKSHSLKYDAGMEVFGLGQ
jgi:hypothetical protein